MGFTAYGVDDGRFLSEDTCLIARDQSNDVENVSLDEPSFFTITAGSTSPPSKSLHAIYLHQKYDNSIQKGDIVIPSWTLDVLNLKNCSEVIVTPCRLVLVDSSSLHSIILIFKRCRGYRHWDEVATSSTFAIPGTWSSDWPSGIPHRTLEKFLPILLHARTLIHKSLVVFDVLDVTMVHLRCRVIAPADSVRQGCPVDLTDQENDSCTLNKSTNLVQGKRAVMYNSTMKQRIKILSPTSSASTRKEHSAASSQHDRKETDASRSDLNSHSMTHRNQDDSKVEENDNKNKNENKNGKSFETSQLSFLKVAYEKTISICNAAFQYNNDNLSSTDSVSQHFRKGGINETENENDENSINKMKKSELLVWNGVHSLLICAPEGAGKTFFLLQIENYFLKMNNSFAENEKLKSEIIVLKLSGKYCDHPPISSSPSSSELDLLPPYNPTDGANKRVRHHLLQCIQMMKTSDISTNFDLNSMEIGDILRVVLLIDDLDNILLQFNSNEDDDSNEGRAEKGLSSELAAFHLRQLLSLLAIPNNGFDQIIVIGVTRISATSLPRCHIGAPEFESVLTLPRPPQRDREVLFTTMIQHSGLILESLPLQDPESDVIDTHISDKKDYDVKLLHEDEIEMKMFNNAEQITNSNIIRWGLRLSRLTAGYLPGDLAGIVRRAAGSSLGQRTFSVNKDAARNNSIEMQDSINKDKEDMIEDKSGNKKENYDEKEKNGRNEYTWLSMLSVVASLPPKQIQKIDFLTNSGGSDENSAVSWIDFNGYEEIKEKLQRILRGMKKQKNMKKLNPDNSHIKNNQIACNSSEIASNSKNLSLKGSCNSVCGIVLYGPSGCGKTYLSRIIAAEAKMNFVSVRSSDLLSKYFGQTESSIRLLFKQVRAAAPCVLFLDEFDVLAFKRSRSDDSSGSSESGLQTRILSTFLNEMDGIGSKDFSEEGGILILVACTDITVLDDALLRPGRLQHHIKLELPNRSDVKNILEGKMQKLKCSDDVCVEELTNILVNDVDYCVTGADIENVCNRALVHRIREHVHADSQGTFSDDKDSQESYTDVSIGMRNFRGALQECFPSLSTENAKREEDSLPSFAWQGMFTEGLNSNPR